MMQTGCRHRQVKYRVAVNNRCCEHLPVIWLLTGGVTAVLSSAQESVAGVILVVHHWLQDKTVLVRVASSSEPVRKTKASLLNKDPNRRRPTNVGRQRHKSLARIGFGTMCPLFTSTFNEQQTVAEARKTGAPVGGAPPCTGVNEELPTETARPSGEPLYDRYE